MATKLKKIVRKKSVKVALFSFIVLIFVLVGLRITTVLVNSKWYYDPTKSKEQIALEQSISEIMKDILVEVKTGVKTERLEKSEDFIYYLQIDSGKEIKEFSNTNMRIPNAFMSESDYYVYYDSHGGSGHNIYIPSDIVWELEQNSVKSNFEFYFAFTSEYTEAARQEEGEIAEKRENIFAEILVMMLFACFLSAIALLLLILGTGKTETGEPEISVIDSWYNEVKIGIIVVVISIGLSGFFDTIRFTVFGSEILKSTFILLQIQTAILISVVVTICGILFLSIVRNIKNRSFFSNTIVGRGYQILKKYTASVFKMRNDVYDSETDKAYNEFQVFVIIEFIIIGGTLFFTGIRSIVFLLGVVLAILVLYFYCLRFKQILKRIEAETEKSLADQLKSEKLKVELITNVSHDLKTPLTAIISYIDLLSKEDLSETAREYTEILNDKSHVLKHIVADVFDIAKATSGSLELSEEKVDIVRLVEQTLAEMNAQIEKSDLKVETSLSQQPSFALIDGAKIYRVLQNVLDNALQYGQKGTRVFVHVENQDDSIIIMIKNTANYEMTFTAEEIVQRFTRGDESRTTEGSGLGLAIAKSFTEANGGTFQVYIDGDQYKVEIVIPKIKRGIQ